MNEAPRGGEKSPEINLDDLKRGLKAAEEELRQIKAEEEEIMDDLLASRKDAPKNWNDYLRRKMQAEQRAFAALEAWGDAVVKRYNLKDIKR